MASNGSSAPGNGKPIPIAMGIHGDVKVKEISKPSTPTLVIVPGVEEQWGAGSASASASSGGLMSSKERVEAMMKGSRGSPLLGREGWEEQGGKSLSVSPRTEMGSGHQNRRSERVVVLEA